VSAAADHLGGPSRRWCGDVVGEAPRRGAQPPEGAG
jgi:hypothetical protein